MNDNKIINPFTLQVEELKFARVLDYDDNDKKVIEYLISLENPSVYRIQLIEIVHRSYQTRGTPFTRKRVSSSINDCIAYSKLLFSDRYNIKVFDDEESFYQFSDFFELVLISIRHIFEGKKRAKEAKEKKG